MLDTHRTIAGKEPLFSFITGKSNQQAYDALCNFMYELPKYNLFILYGDSGVGKSHLAHMARDIAFEEDMDPIYRDSCCFLGELLQYLKHGATTKSFYDGYQRFDLFILEDIQFLCHCETDRAYVKGLLTWLILNNKRILLTSRVAPEELEWLQNFPFLAVKIDTPDLQLKEDILYEYEYIAETTLDPTVKSEIAKAAKDIRRLAGIFNQMYSYNKFFDYKMDLDLLDKILEGYERTDHI